MLLKTDKEAANSWSFSDLIRDIPVPPELAGQLRATQLHQAGNMSVVMVLANLLNCAVVLLSFRNTGADTLLAIWGFGMVFVSGVAFLSHLRSRKKDPKRDRSERSIERFARGASINGLLWAIAPIITMAFSDELGQMSLGIIMAGVMFGGAFLLSRIPQAAMSFMVPVAIGMVIALQMKQNPNSHYLAILTIIYLGVLILAVRWTHRQFVEQHLSQAAVNQQTQLISLLLRDFEESTSDWLWQTNTNGFLEEIPLTLAGEKNQYDLMVRGQELASIFTESEALTVLRTSIERQQGFRDLVLCVEMDSEERWWSMTGKPVYEAGEFVGFRGVASDVTQSKQIEDRIAYMAHYDGLTGLPNRMTLQEKLEKVTRQPLVSGHDRALLWLDLDNFKWVNDTLGHPAGDELLQVVAARMAQVCGPDDFIARLSGDEFALIVERQSGGALEEFLDELIDTLNQPYDLWGSTAHCSASIGVRLFDIYTTEARTLLKHADLALYQAKKQGKGNWCMFTVDLDQKARARLQIEADLNKALEKSELVLHYQPQIDATTRKMVGCEALLRWHHPQRGLVYPGEFIEHAEDNGLITQIGDWVIRQALAEARRLPDHIRVSVNISPLQIHSANLVSTIVNALAANNISPNRLELEITESVLMTDTEFTIQRLHQLKEIGVRIALDDFGTGFSSLSYLRSFPFDKIKIDKCFVSDLESSDDSRAITVATLGLAKSLGMSCTAEGVETEFQSDFLRDHGCDELQGFLISRARPLSKLTHLVQVSGPDVKPNNAVRRISSEEREKEGAVAIDEMDGAKVMRL